MDNLGCVILAFRNPEVETEWFIFRKCGEKDKESKCDILILHIPSWSMAGSKGTRTVLNIFIIIDLLCSPEMSW
jgi:hypothetical protein